MGLLFSERRLNFNGWFRVFEPFYTHFWWSFWLHLLAIFEMEMLVSPILQNVHEFLNFIEKLFVLIVEGYELSIFLLVGRFELDFQFFGPCLFNIF